jgi:hypothetical protein
MATRTLFLPGGGQSTPAHSLVASAAWAGMSNGFALFRINAIQRNAISCNDVHSERLADPADLGPDSAEAYQA